MVISNEVKNAIAAAVESMKLWNSGTNMKP
jgi:hypothetical protein